MQDLDTGFERLSAWELSQLIDRREVSPVEIVNRSLARLEAAQRSINAFVTITAERALTAARQAEAAIVRGERVSALQGIPVALRLTGQSVAKARTSPTDRPKQPLVGPLANCRPPAF